MSQAHTTGDAITSGMPGTPVTSGLDLDLSGRQLGDYRLLRRLGRGAMADVYLAEQGSLRRQVAFKVLKRELADDQTYVRRFHMEAQAAAALVQANIVQIYEVGLIDDFHYIAQEYVEGQNLSQFINRSGTPDVKLALAVMRQVTAALCKAAERGIVHRDIKPENIMLARSGEVKVADFGLARVGATDEALKLTQVGITMGTPLYMSPEQVEGRTLDPRSDIYSLGVTCYHMLTGKPPFRGDTALSVALQHVRTQPERLENLRPDLPPALGRIVHKMLSKDPADRYQSPRELLRELRSLQIDGVDLQWPAELDELGSVETAALGSASWQATQRLQTIMSGQARARNDRRWLWFVAAAVLVALLAGAGAAWKMREPFLLDVKETNSAPPMQNTPQEQFVLASTRPYDEMGWLSVIHYFPNDGYWVPHAQEQLALLYLSKLNKDDLASVNQLMQLFDQLVRDYSEQELQYRVFGVAGQAIVHSLTNHPNKSMEKVSELSSALGGTLNLNAGLAATLAANNPELAQLLQDIPKVIANNRQALSEEMRAKYQKLFETPSTEESGN